MTHRDDVRTLRDFLSRMGTTESAWKALDRIEAALPKKLTLKEQFEAFPIGTRFELDARGDMQFIKVGERAMVRVYTTWDNKVNTEFWDNLFSPAVYEHWGMEYDMDLRKLT